MKTVKFFYQRNCPFCRKAMRYIDEARAAHPELAAVTVEPIEEIKGESAFFGSHYCITCYG